MSGRLALGVSILWIPLAFLLDGVTVLVLPAKLASGVAAASAIGFISFAGLAAAIVVQPLAGRLSDRLRHRIDRRVFLGLTAVPALTGVWLLAGAESMLAIAAAYITIQVSASALQSVQQTLLPEYVRGLSLGRAAGLRTAFDVGGAFLAFLALGALLSGADARPAAVAITVVLLASLVLVGVLVPRPARVATDDPRPGESRPGSTRTLLDGLPVGFARLVVTRFLFLLGTYAVGRFLVLLVADRLGIGRAGAGDETGGLLALFTLVTAIAAFASGVLVDRFGEVTLMRFGVVASAVGIAMFLAPAGLPVVLLAGATMALGTAAFVAANWTAIVRLVPAADSGRLMGLANIGTGGAAACAGLAGPLIDWGGFGPTLVLAAGVTLLALLTIAQPRAITTARELA